MGNIVPCPCGKLYSLKTFESGMSGVSGVIGGIGKVAPFGRKFLDFASGSQLCQERLFTVVKG